MSFLFRKAIFGFNFLSSYWLRLQYRFHFYFSKLFIIEYSFLYILIFPYGFTIKSFNSSSEYNILLCLLGWFANIEGILICVQTNCASCAFSVSWNQGLLFIKPFIRFELLPPPTKNLILSVYYSGISMIILLEIEIFHKKSR